MLPLVSNAVEKKPVKVKTLISEAKAAIKYSKGQADAEKKLLAVVDREDVTTAQRADIYFMASELQRNINDVENMKIYLKQPYDTLKFFSTIYGMYYYLLKCDNYDREPNFQGVVKFKYRNKSRDLMKAYRNNLLNGGKFMLKHSKYPEAYSYFDMYLRSARHPMFDNDPALSADTLFPRVSYWATVAAYNANEPQKALKYIDKAIDGSNESLRTSLQEYKVRCYEVLKQNDKWLESLEEGARMYPSHDYFFLNLMDEYMDMREYDKALALCDTMLSVVGSRDIYWFAESQIYLTRKQFDETIRTADEALKCDSTMTEALYNKGNAYLNKAVIFAETACNDVRDPKCREDRRQLKHLYDQARVPMELARRLKPEDSKRWALPLYRIYLNLNMGNEFAEMEKILNDQ